MVWYVRVLCMVVYVSFCMNIMYVLYVRKLCMYVCMYCCGCMCVVYVGVYVMRVCMPRMYV